MLEVHCLSPDELANYPATFEDARLKELLFRMRGRSYPETLSPAEQAQWQEYRAQRLTEKGKGILTLEEFFCEVNHLRQADEITASDHRILDELEQYARTIAPTF